MVDRGPGTPDPTPGTPPATPERGSGRHRADTVQIPAVPALQQGRASSRADRDAAHRGTPAGD